MSVVVIVVLTVIVGINSAQNTSLSVLKEASAIAPAPVAQMNDTMSTLGLSINSQRPLHAEYASPTSTLVGKTIDTIQISLKKVKNPTGNATVGIFNSTLGLQKSFGSVDVSKLPVVYTQQTFALANNASYKIQAGDYIGIKYTGGNLTDYAAIMTDQNATDPFDGTNTYYEYYTTSWHIYPAYDLTMTLIYHPENTTTPSETIPPTITAPSEILTWSTNSSKTIDLGTPMVSDNIPHGVKWWNSITGSSTINNTVVTLSTGTFNVTWTAQDAAGNMASAFQKVALIRPQPLNPYTKQVFIQFDDGFQSQYDIAKPILDKYHIHATFFIICARPSLPSSPTGYMNWTTIGKLKSAGYDIEGHTMNHPYLTRLSAPQLVVETSGAKLCMASNGFPVTIIAMPHSAGWNNQTVINAIINAGYSFARGGSEPYQNMHCNELKQHSSQTDCETFFPNGTLTFSNRYNLEGYNHLVGAEFNFTRSQNNTKAFEIFAAEVNSPGKKNNATSQLDIPMIYYHRITESNAALPFSEKGDEKILFEAEMRYLAENGVKTLFTNQTAYNTTSNFLYIKPLTNGTGQPSNPCFSYNSAKNSITVKCTEHFAQLASQVNDPSKIAYQGNGTWLVNSTIANVANTTLSIDKSDNVSWLKIAGKNGLVVNGRIEIDGIKITSWNPATNTVINQLPETFPWNFTIPRAYILFPYSPAGSQGGWIKNSDISYIGYNSSGTSGIEMLLNSHDILLSHNRIHDSFFATYSNGAYNVTIDSNEYDHNIFYALDPHTGSHDWKILNNIVHNNRKYGIIFSLQCYNFLVQNNTVYSDGGGKDGTFGGAGIFFSREAHNSIARYNTVHDEFTGIEVSQSWDNQVYGNKVYDTHRGIYVISGFEGSSKNNTIHDNQVQNSTYGVWSNNSTDNRSGNTTFLAPLSPIYMTSNSSFQIENQTFANTVAFSDNTRNNLTITKSGKILVSGIPVIQMMDTTVSPGASVYSQRQLQAEFVTNSSSLVGKSIDTITLQLRKGGSPTGIATIGIFNKDLSVKRAFGTIDSSTLSPTYQDYTFSIPSSASPYSIQAGDRIGIKFSGGNSSNYVSIITDQNGSFDGTNSYYTYYTTQWNNATAKDLHMIQKLGGIPISPSYMNDTTISSGLSAYSGRPVQAEYVSNSSTLVGKPIDTMTVQLKKGGSPSGNFIVGIFNPDLSIKKSFANVTAASLTTSYKDYTFTLGSDYAYQIQTGDRIGIKYTGGNNNTYVAIMTDRNNSFDGTNSYLTYYTTKWANFPTEDLYMTLKLNKIVINPTIYDTDATPAIFHMSSTNMTINNVR